MVLAQAGSINERKFINGYIYGEASFHQQREVFNL